MKSLTENIKLKAFELGFHKIGIARAGRLKEERGYLEAWLEKEYQGEMAWMTREPEKRTDPAILFPGARSLICVALNYFTPFEHIDSAETGKVSRYAWGDDYHDVVKDKLRELLAFVKENDPQADGKICVDTAPIMDKAWAVRAGLGWIGKHTNLITKEFGSWVFLGEIVLNIELEYDTEQIEDHCGTCTACLDACPTDAIVAPYVVDSNRCISYATIELRSPGLPDEIKSDLEGWLYGCDICQDVCPWNRFEQPTGINNFEPREGNINPDLDEIIEMQHDEYVVKFRGSAMKRTKLAGLQRNAAELKANAMEK